MACNCMGKCSGCHCCKCRCRCCGCCHHQQHGIYNWYPNFGAGGWGGGGSAAGDGWTVPEDWANRYKAEVYGGGGSGEAPINLGRCQRCQDSGCDGEMCKGPRSK